MRSATKNRGSRSSVPTEAAHLDTARRHLAAYELIVDSHPAWGATILFYCALQLVEAYFARLARHNRSHSERERSIKSDCQGIWPAYHRLENESLKARYLEGGAFAMPAKSVRRELFDRHFSALLMHVDPQGNWLQSARPAMSAEGAEVTA